MTKVWSVRCIEGPGRTQSMPNRGWVRHGLVFGRRTDQSPTRPTAQLAPLADPSARAAQQLQSVVCSRRWSGRTPIGRANWPGTCCCVHRFGPAYSPGWVRHELRSSRTFDAPRASHAPDFSASHAPDFSASHAPDFSASPRRASEIPRRGDAWIFVAHRRQGN